MDTQIAIIKCRNSAQKYKLYCLNKIGCAELYFVKTIKNNRFRNKILISTKASIEIGIICIIVFCLSNVACDNHIKSTAVALTKNSSHISFSNIKQSLKLNFSLGTSPKTASFGSLIKPETSALETSTVPPLVGDYSGDPFRYPQCVWYVWGRVKAVKGISLEFDTDSGRSAKNWLNEIVPTDGITIVRDRKAIRADSIAVFNHGGEGNGHVVFIENVIKDCNGNPLRVIFSESNWGDEYKPSQKELSFSEFLARSSYSLKGYVYL